MATYGFISLGLIGGSIARAIKKNEPDASIVAYNRSPESLEEALTDKVVDVAVYQTAFDNCDYSAFSDCDYLFLCAPVQKNEEFLEKMKDSLPEKCIITDVGSVKTGIHKCVERLGLTSRFIGGHPMAGSERVGYTNSKATLLNNAYYILTPTEDVPQEKVAAYKALVESFGSIALVLTYDKHDYIVAAISHLPHVIAVALVNLVKQSDYEEGLMKMVAAGGFKDITRIASSSPTMWEQICMTNTDNIRTLLRDYINYLEDVDTSLEKEAGKDIYNIFDTAREYRDSFIVAGSGPIKVSYILTIDINDEPGALAAVATILALNGINIKNIGILHNREYQGGDLKIEFWVKDDLEKAITILEAKNYTIHRH